MQTLLKHFVVSNILIEPKCQPTRVLQNILLLCNSSGTSATTPDVFHQNQFPGHFGKTPVYVFLTAENLPCVDSAPPATVPETRCLWWPAAELSHDWQEHSCSEEQQPELSKMPHPHKKEVFKNKQASSKRWAHISQRRCFSETPIESILTHSKYPKKYTPQQEEVEK